MITFRAIGVSISQTGRTTLVDQVPLYDAVVDIFEISDVPATTKVLSTQTLSVIDEADLTAQCAEILAMLKARQAYAQLAIDIPRKLLAEVTLDATPAAVARAADLLTMDLSHRPEPPIDAEPVAGRRQ